MSEQRGRPPIKTERLLRSEANVFGAAAAGVAMSVVAAILGVVLAVRRHHTPCPDGTYFPEGTTDFRCFTHPHALEGTSIALVALALAVLIGLVAFVARLALASYAKLDSRSPTSPSAS
jgi:hypothetical protein